MKLITKSKYLYGIQCPLLVWTVFNDPESLPEVGFFQQHIFDQGHLIGNLAKELYPKGKDLDDLDFKKQIDRTKTLTSSKKTVFEAALVYKNLYARADILEYNDGYDIIEVKSSTKVKKINIEDVAFQKYVYEKAGIPINKCFLMHVNNQYKKDGKIDPKQILTKEDITEKVNEITNVAENIKIIEAIITGPKPDTSLTECNSEYECPPHIEIQKQLPKDNVFDLYRGGKTTKELFNKGIIELKDIKDVKLNAKQEIQVECAKNKNIHVSKEHITDFLKTLHPPLYYLDFETFNPVIPLFDGMKPYQRIPFQFSLHIDDKEHHEFLYDKANDPRPHFLKALKDVIGSEGTIITYNQSFELGVIRELAEAFPEYKEMEENIKGRIVDLIVPFRNFHYYNPKQKGSASIKKVLPALTGKGYEDLEIGQGGDASVLYPSVMYGGMEGKEKIFKDLLIYCGLDTEGMIWIVDELKKLV